MEDFFYSFALVSAGVSIAIGSIHIFLADRKRDDSYLLFGLMGVCLFIFFLSPPIGFILHDNPPYPLGILIKRIFIFSYYAITPWFILAYSGYKKKLLPYVVTIMSIICYAVMCFTPETAGTPLWSRLAIIPFGCIFILCVLAIRWQYRNNKKQSSYWLAGTMMMYALLFSLTAINQLTNGHITSLLNMKLFFPLHMHSLFFMLIMGHRLIMNLKEKYVLERALQSKEERWNTFTTNAPFIIIELDRIGRITDMNNFGLKTLGYENLSELTHLNWYNDFLAPGDTEYFKQFYENVTGKNLAPPTFKGLVRTKDGRDIVIQWSNFPIRNSQGEVLSAITIGRDITEEEKTHQLVEKLKSELIMEEIVSTNRAGIKNHEIVGTSKALGYALQKAQQVATTNAPVLLEGETGVGKELFANLIQENSSRSHSAFIKVNCGALPKELIEDELFGHEKGAFTSAHQLRKGRFELADGGTIFLDEIGELPLDMQPKLLRVLQNGEFERIGGQKTIKVDVRIIAATNRNLSDEVQSSRFRSDLYYRLNVFPITIPSLRSRKEDLPELISYFILEKSKKYQKHLREISRANLQYLMDYDWPGNIRELKNVIERSVILSEGDILRLDWWDKKSSIEVLSEDHHTLQQVEKEHILSVVQKCHWKINGENGAAEVLAMHPNTLRSKMKKLNIERPRTEGPDSHP
jgi:formate hydrogenlyase transcriptional activator